MHLLGAAELPVQEWASPRPVVHRNLVEELDWEVKSPFSPESGGFRKSYPKVQPLSC